MPGIETTAIGSIFFTSAAGGEISAEWMPPNRAHWCTYLERWVSTKERWSLSMDAAEEAAIEEYSEGCE